MGVWSVDIICGDEALDVSAAHEHRAPVLAPSQSFCGSACMRGRASRGAAQASSEDRAAQVFRRMLVVGGVPANQLPSGPKVKRIITAESGEKILEVRHNEGAVALVPPRRNAARTQNACVLHRRVGETVHAGGMHFACVLRTAVRRPARGSKGAEQGPFQRLATWAPSLK